MAVFVKVVEAGSFTAAAKALEITSSGISRRIASLEARLGVRLLNRTTRQLSLTAAGELDYGAAVRIVEEIGSIERETAGMHTTPRGRLRVTASNAMGHHEIVRLIPQFLKSYPDVRVELRLTDVVLDLVSERIDVAIRSGTLPDSSLMARRLTSTRRIVCAAPRYIEEWGEPETVDDLVNHNCLLRSSQGRGIDAWQFETDDGPRFINVSGTLVANSIDCLKDAAIAGVGILNASEFVVADALASGQLVRILGGVAPPREINLYAVYPSARHLSPAVRAFIDFLDGRLLVGDPD